MKKDLETYRTEVLTHLEYIKEKVDANHNHLQVLNGRVRKTENSISWIKGIGSAITFVISAAISLIFAYIKE